VYTMVIWKIAVRSGSEHRNAVRCRTCIVGRCVQPPAAHYVAPFEDYMAVYDVLQRYRLGLAKHDKTMQDSAYWEPPKPMTPPPGMVPLSGAGGPSWDELRKMPGFVDTWELPLDSYIHFESATRATHYEYFVPLYPQPKRKLKPENRESRPMPMITGLTGPRSLGGRVTTKTPWRSAMASGASLSAR